MHLLRSPAGQHRSRAAARAVLVTWALLSLLVAVGLGATGSAAAAAGAAREVAVGEPVTVGDMTLTVDDVGWVPEITPAVPGGGLRLGVTVRNDSSMPQVFVPLQVVVTDGAGAAAQHWLVDGGVGHPPLGVVTLQPGTSATGDLLLLTGAAPGPFDVTWTPVTAGASGTARWTVELDPDDIRPTAPPPPGAQIPTSGGLAALGQISVGVEQLAAFDIDVELDRDGTMTVTETITYETGPVAHHGILRELVTAQRYDDRYDRVYPFTLLSVSSETAPDDVAIEHPGPDFEDPDASFGDIFGPSARTVLRIGDADVEITGTHTYVIRYRLGAVVNDTAAGEELYWNITGHEWEFPIAATTVRVHGPAEVSDIRCFAGPLGVDDPCAAAAVREGDAVFAHGALQSSQGMTIAVAFPDGTFGSTAPILDERWTFGRAFAVTPATAGGAVVLALGCLLGLATLWRRVARDRQVVGTATDVAFGAGPDRTAIAAEVPVAWGADTSSPVEFVPPDGIRPAQLGMLLDEKADGIDVTATIVDLAVRDHLRIEQIGEAKRNPTKTKHRLVRLPADDAGLLGYERTLLTKLFATGPSVELDDLRNTFATSLQEVQQAVEADAVGRGWFPKSPSKVRTRWALVGTLAVLLAIGLLVGLAIFTHVTLLGVPLVLAAVALLASAKRMPRRTPLGTGLARRVGGFRELIVESEAHRAVWAEDKGLFTQYLPYAIVFGCTERWAKTFEALGGQPPDTSFYLGTQPLLYHDLTRSLDGFSSSASSTLSSTPGGSGGSGFSGGSSGGGGGGGGGGSW